MMQQSLRASPAVKKRAKSVYQQRNLGTIKKRKKEKQEEKEVNNGETILRILRMRCVLSPAFPCVRRTNHGHFISSRLCVSRTVCPVPPCPCLACPPGVSPTRLRRAYVHA